MEWSAERRTEWNAAATEATARLRGGEAETTIKHAMAAAGTLSSMSGSGRFNGVEGRAEWSAERRTVECSSSSNRSNSKTRWGG